MTDQNKVPRIIHKNGNAYIRIQDPAIARERRERDGYSKGYEDGEKFAILKPPISLNSPLPTFNFEKLSKKYDQSQYQRGFSKAYFKLVRSEMQESPDTWYQDSERG